MAVPPVVRLFLLTLPPETTQVAARTSSTAFDHVDTESSDLRQEPRITGVLLGEGPVSIGRGGTESWELELEFVVRADDDVAVTLLAYGEVLSLFGEKVLEPRAVHDRIISSGNRGAIRPREFKRLAAGRGVAVGWVICDALAFVVVRVRRVNVVDGRSRHALGPVRVPCWNSQGFNLDRSTKCSAPWRVASSARGCVVIRSISSISSPLLDGVLVPLITRFSIHAVSAVGFL